MTNGKGLEVGRVLAFLSAHRIACLWSSDRQYSVWCGRSLQMGLFKKSGAPVRPAALGRRHGPDAASGIADRVSVAYGQAGAAAGAPRIGDFNAEVRDLGAQLCL